MAIQNRQLYVSIIHPRCYMRLKQSHHNNIWDWVQNVSKLCHNINCTNQNKQNMTIQNKQLYVSIICPRCYMRLKQSHHNNNLRLGPKCLKIIP